MTQVIYWFCLTKPVDYFFIWPPERQFFLRKPALLRYVMPGFAYLKKKASSHTQQDREAIWADPCSKLSLQFKYRGASFIPNQIEQVHCHPYHYKSWSLSATVVLWLWYVSAELYDLAITLLSLPSSSACIDRVFSNLILTKLHKRLDIQKAETLVTWYNEILRCNWLGLLITLWHTVL